MNLRNRIRTREQCERVERLVVKGLLNYQPFILRDDLQTGAGYEFMYGEFKGMIYWPSADADLLRTSPEFRRLVVDPRERDRFSDANARLRAMYEDFIETALRVVGDASELTFADIGCNAGYFPISWSLRGAKTAVGFDRENYGEVFHLLN